MTLVGVILAAAFGAMSMAWGAQHSERNAAENWLFSCGSTPFGLDVFEGPVGAENENNPAARALRRLLSEEFFDPLPDEGYRVITSDADYVDFGVGEPRRGGVPHVAVARDADDGEWDLAAYGRCTPYTVVEKEGVSSADWKLANPTLPPSKRDTRVKALLTERACASGRPSDNRIRPPQIVYGVKRIVILALVERRRGNTQTCPGNPPAKYTFRLDEPIGDRVLADGAEYPFRVRHARVAEERIK